MYVLDYSLNMMTLLALSLAIGLLIDDAVVVRETITHRLERGEDPMSARLQRHAGRRPRGARHHAHPRGGVRPGGLHDRHRRPVLPAVRHHHLGGGAHLAVRRLHPRPDALGAAGPGQRMAGVHQRENAVAAAIRRFLDGSERVYAGILRWVLGHKRVDPGHHPGRAGGVLRRGAAGWAWTSSQRRTARSSSSQLDPAGRLEPGADGGCARRRPSSCCTRIPR